MPFLLPAVAIMEAETGMAANTMAKLIDVMSRLRDPEHGCPWDLQQDFKSIVTFTVEETYELADAIKPRILSRSVKSWVTYCFK